MVQSYRSLAEVLKVQGQLSEAEAYAHQAVDLCKDPKDAHHDFRAAAYSVLAEIQHARGLWKEADATYAKTIRMQREYVKGSPPHGTWKHFLASTLLAHGKFLKQRDRNDEAVQCYQEATGIWKTLAQSYPNAPGYGNSYSRAQSSLIDLLIATGQTEEVNQLFRDMNPRTAEEYVKRAKLYKQLRKYDDALADYEKAAELNPDYALTCNQTAWVIVRIPGKKTELTQFAVALAQKAVELKPKSASFSNTLGVAQYRAGNWREAIDALQKSEELYKGRHLIYNGFFLSMAHWQLGENHTAHEWYKKSAVWMERNKRDDEEDDEELIRFRTEAEGLLGIPVEATKPAIRKLETGSQKTVKQTNP